MNRNKTNIAGQGDLSEQDLKTRVHGTYIALAAWAAWMTGLFWWFLW